MPVGYYDMWIISFVKNAFRLLYFNVEHANKFVCDGGKASKNYIECCVYTYVWENRKGVFEMKIK